MAGKKGMKWGKKLAREQKEELSARQLGIELQPKIAALVPQDCPARVEATSDPGRSSNYSRPVVLAFLSHVVNALPVETAARLSGVNPSTLIQWIKDHPALADSIRNAQALSQEYHLDHVRNGFQKNPRLALDVLERRFPREFAPTKNVQHSGHVTHNTVNWGVLHDGIDVQSDIQDAQVVDTATPALTDANGMLTELCPENDGQPGDAEGAGSPHPSPKNV